MARTRDRTIGAAGTAARAIVGIGFILTAIRAGLGWADLVTAVVVLPAVAVVSAMVVNRTLAGSTLRQQSRVPWSWAQIMAAVAVILAVIAIGVGLTFVTPLDGPHSLLLFLGGSMLVAVVAGYEGCEVLALPNLAFGRSDAIWCPVYSPIDRVETATGDRPPTR
jgi:hypothetical protein